MTESNMNHELWRVQLSTGEIRTMTLDALDRAFEEGRIDARVPVLAPGAASWTTLGEAAGLDDRATESGNDECTTEAAPSLSPVAISPSSAPSSSNVFSPSDSDLELPDALDLDDEAELARLRRRGVVTGAISGALALAAMLAVVAGKIGGSVTPADVTPAPAVQAAPPPVEPLPLPPPAAAAKPAELPEPAKEVNASIGNWQKKLFADTDKAQKDKPRAKSQEKQDKPGKVEGAPKRKPQPKSSSPGLLNGGDRFDPLNGQL